MEYHFLVYLCNHVQIGSLSFIVGIEEIHLVFMEKMYLF